MSSRFDDEDKTYFAFRSSLTERSFDVSDMDHFTLFAGMHNFARKKFIVDEFEKTLDLTGNIYEFGTWRGATAVLLASWYRMRRPQGHKILYVFDTFEGLAAGTAADGNAQGRYEGAYKSARSGLEEIVEARGLSAYVRFVAGNAIETSAAHFKDTSLPVVSFALLDMDLYEPTKSAIDQVLPNLVPGGKIIFDEGTVEEWEGEQRALAYLLSEAKRLGIGFSVSENPFTRQPTTVFTRA